MATLFTPPRYSPIDGNGLAMPGALLYFYQTGTSTLQDTYSDSGLTSANANPVVADSNGLFGDIYLGSAADYKVILKTSAGVTVYTVDPYFASSTTGRSVVADQNYALAVADRLVAFTSITSARTLTLLPAVNYPAGTRLVVVDESGLATSTVTVSLVPDGTDTINGVNATLVGINSAYGSIEIESDGTSKWTIIDRTLNVPMLRSYLSGLGTSNNAGTPNTKIDVGAGVCADSTNVAMMTVAAGTIDCATTGANGLDTGTLGNSTWYHVYAIGKTDGTTALLASTSAATPTMPSGYTLKRWLWAVKTDGSAHILPYVQDGDICQWVTPVADISAANPGTAAVTRTLASVPTGVRVQALIQLAVANAGSAGGATAYVSDLATTDTAPANAFTDIALADTATGGVASAGGRVTVRTNTSAQIRSRLSFSDANVTLTINTLGWVSRRGRDA